MRESRFSISCTTPGCKLIRSGETARFGTTATRRRVRRSAPQLNRSSNLRRFIMRLRRTTRLTSTKEFRLLVAKAETSLIFLLLSRRAASVKSERPLPRSKRKLLLPSRRSLCELCFLSRSCRWNPTKGKVRLAPCKVSFSQHDLKACTEHYLVKNKLVELVAS